MEIKVREVGSVEQKSVQEIENQLLNEHEQMLNEEANLEKEIVHEDVQEDVQEELTDDKVLSYLGKRYGRELNSFDDLVQQKQDAEEMDEEIATYLKYKKETGRSFEDFKQLNKDYDSMNQSELLRAYLRETNSAFDEEDIDILMEDYSYDEDLDDDADIKRIKLKTKKMAAEAKQYFNSQKEKYRVPLESRKNTSLEDDEDYKAYKQYMQEANSEKEENDRKSKWFQQKTDELFGNEFKGFEFNINDKKFTFSPGEAAEIKKLQSNPLSFISKYLDENGMMKDPVGYHRSLAMALNPDKFAKFFYEQGKAEGTDDLTRKIKNVDMSERRSPEATNRDSVKIREVNPDSGRGLKIRSIKRV